MKMMFGPAYETSLQPVRTVVGIAKALLHIFDMRAYMSVDLRERKAGDI